jgi:mono/diheme cytochrome c family protein
MMRLTSMLGILLIATAAAAAEPQVPKVPKDWQFDLPKGDAATGKMVYGRLECFACHARTGFQLPPGRATQNVGPRLDGYHALPPAYLAESVIRSHTAVAAPGYVLQEGKAGMGNYNHFLTVQELIDLVAYLGAPATP